MFDLVLINLQIGTIESNPERKGEERSNVAINGITFLLPVLKNVAPCSENWRARF